MLIFSPWAVILPIAESSFFFFMLSSRAAFWRGFVRMRAFGVKVPVKWNSTNINVMHHCEESREHAWHIWMNLMSMYVKRCSLRRWACWLCVQLSIKYVCTCSIFHLSTHVYLFESGNTVNLLKAAGSWIIVYPTNLCGGFLCYDERR